MRRKRVIGLGVLAATAVVAALWAGGVFPGSAGPGGENTAASDGPEPIGWDAGPAADDGDDPDAAGLAAAPPRASVSSRNVYPAGDPRGAAAEAAEAAARAAKPGIDAHVVRADGTPAAGVVVVATGLGRRNDFVEAKTGADGKFRLDVDAGRWDLVFRGRDGALLVRGYFVDGSAVTTPFRLGGAAELRVEVKRKGEPVSGALIEARLAYGDTGDRVIAGATDSAGVFAADAVPAGPYRVEVWPAGDNSMLAGEHGAIPPPLALTKTLEVSGRSIATFDLPGTVHLRGTITDSQTKAGVNALVEVVVALDAGTGTGFTRSDDTGAYDLEVPAGRVRSFRVDDYQHAPFPAPADEKALYEALRPLRDGKDVVRDVVLAAGSRLSGTVTTGPDKTPAPAGIWLRFEDKNGHVLRTAPTNVMGGYLVLALPAGDATVTLESPGWYLVGDAKRTVKLPPPADASETKLDLEVTRASTVSGVVVGADGAPVRGASVRLIGGGLAGRDARRVGRILESTTGADGRFAIVEVPPGVDVRVEAALGEAKSTPSASFKLPDADPSPVKLVLAATGRITGRVVDLVTRAPLAGIRVRLDSVGEPAGRGSRRLETGPDGRFEAGGFVPGGWRLTPVVRNGEYLPGVPRDVELGTDLRDVIVDLVLDPGRVIAGVVLDAGGAPAAGARVVLTGTSDATGKAVERRAGADAQGRFRIAALEGGTYALTASRRGAAPAEIRGLRGGEERLIVRLAKASVPAGGESR